METAYSVAFDIEYIKEKDNEIADASSRLFSTAERSKSSDPDIISLGEEFTIPTVVSYHSPMAQYQGRAPWR